MRVFKEGENSMNEEFEAKHGEKMITLDVKFWTNNIAEQDGHVVPKHGWTWGVVRVQSNPSHGIKTNGQYKHFHTMCEIGPAIEAARAEADVVLHANPTMKKYLVVE
jgi:hypothetical protein